MNSEMKSNKKMKLVDISFLTSLCLCFLLSYWFFGVCAASITLVIFSIVTVPVIYWIKREKESTVSTLGRIILIAVYIVISRMICSMSD